MRGYTTDEKRSQRDRNGLVFDICSSRTADHGIPLLLHAAGSVSEWKDHSDTFEGYIDLIRSGDWFAFTYLSVGNIVWFVPFGMYLQYMGISGRLFQTALYGFLFSLLIESMQFVFGTGFSELDDLVQNTLGAWIGGAVVIGFRR